jgi:hypothetical protein
VYFAPLLLFLRLAALERDLLEAAQHSLVQRRTSQLLVGRPAHPFDARRHSELLVNEYGRLLSGHGSRVRFAEANRDYALCSTYSAVLPVPGDVSDAMLRHAARFRVRARLPVLSYVHSATGAVLLRSGQPLVGLSQKRCVQDERLVASWTHATGRANGRLLIVDARPSTSALANTMIGAGVERLECYTGSERVYLRLENIHVVREAHDRLAALVKEGGACMASAAWNALEAECTWLEHIRLLLEGTGRIVNALCAGQHVLVHCSDGWDRTTQLCSLAALCIDPFYRSREGFERLIAKDWLAQGHRFADRRGFDAGDLESEEDARSGFFAQLLHTPGGSQRCPVFLQFIEACVQLLRQHPLHFASGFDDGFLHSLVAEAYGEGLLRTSRFYGNCEADRADAIATGSLNGNALVSDSPDNGLSASASTTASTTAATATPASIATSLGEKALVTAIAEAVNDPGIVRLDYETGTIIPSAERSKMILWPALYQRFT